MNLEMKNYDTFEQKSGKEFGSDSAAQEAIFERGAEAYEKADQAVKDAYHKTSEKVSDAYDRTSEKVSQTYEKARSYSSDNPGKTILIALGIGVGLGLLLGAGTHRSHNGRLARPVVNALSDLALDFWR